MLQRKTLTPSTSSSCSASLLAGGKLTLAFQTFVSSATATTAKSTNYHMSSLLDHVVVCTSVHCHCWQGRRLVHPSLYDAGQIWMLWWYYSKHSVPCHPLRKKLSLTPVFSFSTKGNDYMVPCVDFAAANFSPKPRITSLQLLLSISHRVYVVNKHMLSARSSSM